MHSLSHSASSPVSKGYRTTFHIQSPACGTAAEPPANSAMTNEEQRQTTFFEKQSFIELKFPS